MAATHAYYLYVGELSVLRTHELPHGCWVSCHLHGLPHQLRIVQDVSQLGITLHTQLCITPCYTMLRYVAPP